MTILRSRRHVHDVVRLIAVLFLSAGLITVTAPGARAGGPVTGKAAAPATPLAQQWSNWAEIPGGGATPDAPAATVFNNTLYLFVRGTDNKIYLNRLGSSWSGWSEVPGAGATPAAPAATVFSGKLYLFVPGTDDRIYQNQLNNTSWSGWSQVPGNGVTKTGVGADVYRNVLYLYAGGTNNHIFLNQSGADFPA
jgi:hypothetical protein